MLPAFITRFRPSGPWRLGPDTGARDRVDRILHSDTLCSAVSGAMAHLGLLDDWLAEVFQGSEGPAVRFSSCFPFLDSELFIVPPRGLWPPSASPKVRWKGARFVPLTVVEGLIALEPPDEDRWIVDGASECLVPASKRGGPYRPSVRSGAAVDRWECGVEPHVSACLEFAPEAGMWAAVVFANQEAWARWSEPVRAAMRLLADSGFGGRTGIGWGRSEMPEFTDGIFPDLILPVRPAPPSPSGAVEPALAEMAHWLLSLFSPSQEDSVDWERGDYSLINRVGRVQSPAGSGALKKPVRMVAEGSVLFAAAPVKGSAPDVAPDGFPHPVYRSGFALTIPIPWGIAP